MRLRKIKITKEQKVSMSYEVHKGESWDEYSFSSSDKAVRSFYDAFDALREDVLSICELPDHFLSRIRVKGISISFAGENDTMGMTITGLLELNKSNAPLVLNTPYKIEDFYGETGDEAQLMDTATLKRVKALIEEAEKYINGEREQVGMFEGAGVN